MSLAQNQMSQCLLEGTLRAVRDDSAELVNVRHDGLTTHVFNVQWLERGDMLRAHEGCVVRVVGKLLTDVGGRVFVYVEHLEVVERGEQ